MLSLIKTGFTVEENSVKIVY